MFYSKKFDEKILLKNLVNFRWIAIFGQIFTILVVNFFLDIPLPLIPCFIVIVVSILINFFSFLSKSRSIYLSEKEAFYFLLYDTIQLASLLYLTGGIYNPFCLLLIAPVIISASYLKIYYSIILSLFSIMIVFFLSLYYLEIYWIDKFIVPNLFTHGLVLALIISIIFIAVYVYILANSSRKIFNALSQTQIALINQKKISEMGSLAAASAHELSTPLNTILLVIGDLKKTIGNDLKSDILLLEDQANRCKKILFNLSKNPQNIKDTFLQRVKISNLVNQNFEKFVRKEKLNIDIDIDKKENEPLINFSEEIDYGLGNIIQNATEHANKKINVKITWDKKNIFIKIQDDGKGFSTEILERIGNPYISDKNKENSMGLGIFIAKNLIENIGGNIKFYNKMNTAGSLVEICLKRNT